MSKTIKQLANQSKANVPFLNVFLALAYYLLREEEHSRFNQVLDYFIGNVKDNAEF